MPSTDPEATRRLPRRRLVAAVMVVVLGFALAVAAFAGRSLLPVAGPGVAVLPPPIVALPGASLLAGAGDIASCGNDHDALTGRYLETLDAAIFTTGDNAYERGSTSDYEGCYDPVWGRLRDRTYPVPGNHEYVTQGASGYFAYFGARVGTSERLWYVWERNGWRLYALDSNCILLGTCEGVDGQAAWLRSDLAANPARCVAAYWHHPRYSSGRHGDTPAVQPLWEALVGAGAELLLVGHDHSYERFAPRDAQGAADPDRGLREIVVGTGGKELYDLGASPLAEASDDDTFGVLVLTLWPDRYEWRFVATEGTFTDEGSAACH